MDYGINKRNSVAPTITTNLKDRSRKIEHGRPDLARGPPV